MILYDPDHRFDFLDFGIRIPVHDTKATRTVAALRAHPVLGPLEERWNRRPSGESVTRADLLRVHRPEYVAELFGAGLEAAILRTYELIDATGNYHRYAPETAVRPLRELFDRILRRVAGTVQCGRLALEHGFCFHFGGGMHHAHADTGKGFCPVNDIVVAIRKLQAEGRVRTVWIIDVDAHKGDGTAALTRDDATIATLDVHMAAGWPLDGPAIRPDSRPDPAFVPADIDVPIGEGEEERYVPALREALVRLDRYPRPDLAVVVCGADPYEHDELPSTAGLRLTLAQLLERDRAVFDFLRNRNIPAAYLMAGGYGVRTWEVYARFLEWALARLHGVGGAAMA
jgi:acetoin utilization deacetylase AcuC-like enzyme